MSHKLKLLLVCLDGANFSYLTPALQSGLMPYFSECMSAGVHGILRSVMPCQTPATWPTLATGCLPARHGIFGWWKTAPSFDKLIPVTCDDLAVKGIWHAISNAGYRVGVVNAPIFAPAETVNGVFVSGFGTPFAEQGMIEPLAYPPGLAGELSERFDYKVLISPSSRATGDLNHLIECWADMELNRARAVESVVVERNLDVAMVGFHMPAFFHHIVEKHDSALDVVYATVDRLLQHMGKLVDKETTLLVVSDHGATPIRRNFMINNWLERNGYTRYCNGHQKSFGTIDWQNTRAYCISNYGQIRINKSGREPFGTVAAGNEFEAVVESLIDELFDVRDPQTGLRIFAKVERSSAYYGGVLHPTTPDITCELADFSYYVNAIDGYYGRNSDDFEDVSSANSRLQESGYFSQFPRIGDHNLDGIIVAVGPNMPRNEKIHGFRLVDVAPTVLLCLGIDIPEFMDGRPNKLFGGGKRPSVTSPTFSTKEADDPLKGELESLRLQQELRSLGYRV